MTKPTLKIFTLIFTLAFYNQASSQELQSKFSSEYGEGFMWYDVNYDSVDQQALNFFESPKDKSPKRTLKFYINSYTTFSIKNARELKVDKWFKPNFSDLDHGSFEFKYYQRENNLIEVELNNDERLWLKVDTYMKVRTWDEYLLKRLVRRPDKQLNPFRKEPTDNSDLLSEPDYECFKVLEISSHWIKLEFVNWACDIPNNINFSGWIKWRDDSKLLIEPYFIN